MGLEETVMVASPGACGAESTGLDAEKEALDEGSGAAAGAIEKRRRYRPRRLALVFGTVTLAVMAGLGVVQGLKANHVRADRHRQAEFLAAARQGAVDLTTISYTDADADVRRILDSATGTFLTDFETRSGPFVEEVKRAKAVTTGSVAEAAVESHDERSARVLVAVSVKTTNSAGAQDDPRRWRMRIDVQRIGSDVKVSNVEFVP